MLTVFGSRISYYTGKLEAYLRFRSIEYQLLPTIPHQAEIRAGTGTSQMPAVRLADGRWLSDSTPILAWLESQQPAPSIYPDDGPMRFVALLLEDYADEWLWRSAMHYRWSYGLDRRHASGLLADEQVADRWIPRALARSLVARRQRRGFVEGDGVCESTRAHVEQGYLNALDRLSGILEKRPFLLGDGPTIADFGFMGPMLRHFGQDPTPAEIMRTRAPGVYEWVARMWNRRATGASPRLLTEVDAPLVELLVEACETHLVALRENAVACDRGLARYDQQIQGCDYRALPSSRYRVWCLERLRDEWRALEADDREVLRGWLPDPAAAVLWDDSCPTGSGYDPERRAPFNQAINVFGTGVPR